MGDRAIDIDLSNGTSPGVTEQERANFEAKLAQVLDRTLTVDVLNVNLPAEVDGFWCAKDGLSIAQAELRGYKIDTEYAAKNDLLKGPDGKATIADVIFMVRPKWMKESETKLINKRYRDQHLKDPRKQKEEKDFEANSPLGVSDKVGSQYTEVTGPEITEALKKPKGESK